MKKVYPISSYQMFCADNWKNIKEEIKDSNGNFDHLEIQQILKNKWKNISENEKRKYIDSATHHRKEILQDENKELRPMYQEQRKNYLDDIQKQKQKLRRRTPIPVEFDPSQENRQLLSQKKRPNSFYRFRPWNLSDSPYMEVIKNGNPLYNPHYPNLTPPPPPFIPPPNLNGMNAPPLFIPPPRPPSPFNYQPPTNLNTPTHLHSPNPIYVGSSSDDE
jgi:hypothetical protein